MAAMFRYSEVAAVASIYEKYKKAAYLHARIELLENSTGPKALKCRIGTARNIGYLQLGIDGPRSLNSGPDPRSMCM